MQLKEPNQTQKTIDFIDLGMRDYHETWSKMKSYTENRDDNSQNQIWILEHPPVFTLGQAGKKEHLLLNSDIPVVNTDRGGQITYHGPGQIVMYLLLNLRQLKVTIRELVCIIEKSVINTLKQYGIDCYGDREAPGVYTDINNTKAKICSIGLRVKRGCTYHGLALNFDMDLKPFTYINPCGFQNLKVTQIKDLNNSAQKEEIISKLCEELKVSVTREN